LKEDFIQADVKNQQNSSETKESDQEVFNNDPKPSKKGKVRRVKGKEFFEESEEETEYTDQNDYGQQNHNHYDNSNPNSQNYGDERDENVEEEAENVYQEDDHENETPDTTTEPPNPYYDEDREENPDSETNHANSTEDDPYVEQSDSGHTSDPQSSKTNENKDANDEGNKKGANNTNFNAFDHSRSHGGQRGQQNPPGGHKPNWYQSKRAYESWITKKIPYRHPKHTFDCLPAALADDLGLMRLAMVFSVGLGEILNWKMEERILKWSENLIKVFGLGLRWEYYDDYPRGNPLPYPNHGSRQNGITEGTKKWQVMAGRLFFQDLLTLVTHETLDEEGQMYYCEMARMLLTSIWARLGNRSDPLTPEGNRFTR
jgi:hypothetical protein